MGCDSYWSTLYRKIRFLISGGKLLNYFKSRWQFFAIGIIGLYFIFLAFLFSPSFIENYILFGMQYKNSFTRIVQYMRIASFVLGSVIILSGFILEKWPAFFSRSIRPGKKEFFSFKNIFITSSAFIIVIISMHIVVKVFRRYFKFSSAPFWPISNFIPQIPDLEHLFAACAIFLIFYFFLKYLSRTHFKLAFLMLFGIFLVLGTNALQIQGFEGKTLLQSKGWDTGFVVPITGSSINGSQYYHDAIKITDAFEFINTFEKNQPAYLVHARTHPPGATLTIYLLLKIFGDPALISIVIGIISVSLSTFFLYKILSIEFKEDISGYVTFLFVLIPGIQIFYVATIDALISTFLLGSLYFYLSKRSFINIIGSLFFVFLASFLTFTFVFILPIMIGYELLIRKDYLRSVYMVLGMGLIYALISIFLNYNYVNSLMMASALENPLGFKLIFEPLTYFVTRVEGISEIIFFSGPFLTLLIILGLHKQERGRSNLLTITWLAIFSLLILFATGAFRTGETARAAIFIYPFLIFPVAYYLQVSDFSLKDRNILLYLVFAQTILMQTFGFYYS